MSEKLVKGMFGIVGIIWLISAMLGMAVFGGLAWLIFTIITKPELVSAWFHRLTA